MSKEHYRFIEEFRNNLIENLLDLSTVPLKIDYIPLTLTLQNPIKPLASPE